MDIISKIIKQYKFEIYFFIILFLGIYFRFSCLDKNGLWIDEIYCHSEAIKSFPFGILNSLKGDLHSPLYYFLLHFWINLFGDSEVVLRLLSVIFGTLSIPAAYFTGKELSSKNTGILFSALVSTNSLLIYYSQEIKFYSLLVFLSTMAIYYMVKINLTHKAKYMLALGIINSLILYTFTISFTFVITEILLFLIFIFYTKREAVKKFLYTQLIIFCFYLPYIPLAIAHLTHQISKVFNYAFDFSFLDIVLTVQNFFSPILFSLFKNMSSSYQIYLQSNLTNIFFILIVIIPVIIYFYGIYNATKTNKFHSLLFFTGLSYIIIVTIAAILGKCSFLTRYVLLTLPIMLILASYGLLQIQNKILKKLLISFLLFINVSFLFFIPTSAQRMDRDTSFKTIGSVLKSFNFSKKDIIIMPYLGDLLYKYYPINNQATLSTFSLYDIQSIKNKDLYGENLTKSISKDNAYDILKPYLQTDNIINSYENYVKIHFINRLNKGQYLILIMPPAPINRYKPQDLKYITSKNSLYYKSKLYDLVLSKGLNDLVKISFQNLKNVTTIRINHGAWSIIIFKNI